MTPPRLALALGLLLLAAVAAPGDFTFMSQCTLPPNARTVLLADASMHWGTAGATDRPGGAAGPRGLSNPLFLRHDGMMAYAPMQRLSLTPRREGTQGFVFAMNPSRSR